jgi:hypothetical protein
MSMEPLRLKLSEFSEIAILKSLKVPKAVGPLEDLNLFQFRTGLLNCAFTGREGIPSDLVDYPPSSFELAVSSYIDVDEKIRGMFLVKKNDDGELELMLLQATGADYKLYLAALMRHTYARAIENYPMDITVVIPRNSKETIVLTKKLFPGR